MIETIINLYFTLDSCFTLILTIDCDVVHTLTKDFSSRITHIKLNNVTTMLLIGSPIFILSADTICWYDLALSQDYWGFPLFAHHSNRMSALHILMHYQHIHILQVWRGIFWDFSWRLHVFAKYILIMILTDIDR